MNLGCVPQSAFARLGPAEPLTPVVLAVPHAGRAYDPALLDAARLPLAALETIEDRHADRLIDAAVAAGAVALVAHAPRALVDLNRDPREIDPVLLRTEERPADLRMTDKVAGGLGVIPSRIAAGGAVWRQPLAWAEIAARLEAVHAPYHAAIAQALDAAQRRHGHAVLIDCHSMPPLPAPSRARLVVGDRYGASAAPGYAAAALATARHAGLGALCNRPYAGGYTLDRHGAPARGRHAVQIEIDRSLYLDASLRAPGPGLAAMQALVAALCAALGALRAFAQAAE
ncbi:N-formylglutamate amidohydrolase [Sphingomonas morindae]|uniref:N-formylglutamate amidohydrolase n=1 Tax=Sphingomonas morindae TaxID=1541170 RepID=A0ABY4X7U3_9SPHN|nr:N-formylglutamate amidohydrolase [Sphingomonas morindae]USI72915.1 N-formylglutamate amidohydrolase [Sphingomonas morindae]